MVVIMVHWLIKKGYEEAFELRWTRMTVDESSGLYREILTKLDRNGKEDDKFHTFSIGDPYYSTYVNIGIWKSIEHFDNAIGKYIPEVNVEDKGDRRVQKVELEEFEFKMRERAILQVINHRGGALPEASLPN